MKMELFVCYLILIYQLNYVTALGQSNKIEFNTSDLEVLNTLDTVRSYKEIKSLPVDFIKIFKRSLPNRKAKPFIDMKDYLLINSYRNTPRVFMCAFEFNNDYWLVSYRVWYGQYSTKVSCFMKYRKDKSEFQYQIFCPVDYNSNFRQLYDYILENDFKRTSIKPIFLPKLNSFRDI